MWNQFIRFFLLFGVSFGVIAGIITYLITYSELVKHFAEKEYPRKLAIRSGLAAFVFFLIIGAILGLFVVKQ
ncbi:hypothetical protein [Prolixibacter denitrificans]|uniref:Immunity protein 17 of polymorphic toxin system n=1 Tax=Prolixibacter denitrificans TaxID=1541063 RepID=A0A2P8C9X0_9BACT|nr:hypothetical protein [Prolixibacter denitrificans]PSK81754.1 hypothetical protein CLV93_108155 [Prolixibacter denitrificans]GET21275.1 hypothetical protein JCM18694_15210 [Prolixibacter denitrificans]